jgi:GT2 family glycosyltransferase
VISTRNRKDSLRNALASAMKQSIALEIIVLDDGSNDGTAEMVRGEFPSVRLERFEQSAGYVARRNHGASLASAPILFSIDDDAALPFPGTVATTLGEFDDPRVGAVAVPFVNVHQSPQVTLTAPAGGVFVTFTFTGTAYAVRRELFLEVGGFRACLLHQGEEMDFCIRLLEAGRVVRIGRADPIHHFESPRRDTGRMDYFGRRNDILFAWNNVPLPALIPHLCMTTFNGLRLGLKVGRFGAMLRGVLGGYSALLGGCAHRKPVSWNTYLLARDLKKQGALAIENAIQRLRG